MRVALLLGLLILAGCPTPAKPTLTPPDKLREAFPALTTPFTLTEFRARPGLVNQHIKKQGNLVGMLLLEDLLESPEKRALFASSSQRIKDCPAMSTSMGGGLALLYNNRFKAEVIAMNPSITDTQRRQWLEGFHFDVLKGQ